MLNETLEYIGIAFVSSALLIVLSKIILQSLIRRPADYYDAEEVRQEELMLNAGGLSIFSEHETTPEGETIESTHLEPHISRSEEPSEIEEREFRPVREKDERHSHFWEETYADIRRSLEEAYADTVPEQSEPEEKPAAQIPQEPQQIQEPEPAPPSIPLTKAGKPRKPSMKMRKDELIAIAASMDIVIPDKATKAVILELINGEKAHTEE